MGAGWRGESIPLPCLTPRHPEGHPARVTKPDTARAPGDAARPIIAVFNSSSDTVELLRTALEADGLHTVPGHIADLKKGELDFVSFIEHHRRP